jgi:RHS repeat-associated protein
LADRTYVHGGRVDEIVASQVGGLWYFHHYDGQGNCMMLTAGTQPGTIQEQYDYDAFGFPYFYTAGGGKLLSPPRTRFLFTGREWLSELRIYDYRARQYQPELGRFLQPDPKQFDAGDYNLYRYCHNDPVNKSDPTGLDMQFDMSLTTAQKLQVVMILALATRSPEGKQAVQTMIDSTHTVTVGVYPQGMSALTGNTISVGNGLTDDKVGTDAKMTLQTESVERTRFDGSKETVTPDVMAAHEAGHGAEIVSGTAQNDNSLLPSSGKDYINQPSEAGAVKVEDSIRVLDKLLPRDN